MGKYFEFDKKIGWAQLLAVAALIVSGVSLWVTLQRSGARVVVSKDMNIGGSFFDDAKQRWRAFGYDRLVLSNVGGSPVTLIGFRPLQQPPFPGMVAAIIKDGKAIEVQAEVLLVDEFFEDIRNNPKMLSRYQGWSLERLGTLNRLIPSGGITTLNVAVLYDAYKGTEPISDYIFMSLEMRFSDGTKYPYQVAAELRPSK